MNTKLNKKTIIILILSLTALLLSILFYIIITTTGIILKPQLSCNFKDKVYLKDFILSLDGTLQNNYKIDTNTIGTKKLKIVYKNKYGFYKIKNFNIEIKDVTKPTILVNNEYIVEVGYDKNIEEEILCADDYDDNVECELNGSYNLDKEGIYPLTITAKDKSNNTTKKDFNLRVISKAPKNEIKSQSYISYKDIYIKYKNNNTLIGIDISKWQEEIDFKKLKENNIEFVIIKIGGQPTKDSKEELDPFFKKNITNAQKEGLKVGIYFYSYAKNTKEAEEQAKFVINNIKDYKIDLPITFDWENWKSFNSFNISFNTLNNIAKTFIKEINNSGYKANLYSSEYYLENIWLKEDYKNIWLANYGKVKYKGKYNMWQLCNDGKVEGIKTYVDIDILYLN